jgi:hypothetical protein
LTFKKHVRGSVDLRNHSPRKPLTHVVSSLRRLVNGDTSRGPGIFGRRLERFTWWQQQQR